MCYLVTMCDFAACDLHAPPVFIFSDQDTVCKALNRRKTFGFFVYIRRCRSALNKKIVNKIIATSANETTSAFSISSNVFSRRYSVTEQKIFYTKFVSEVPPKNL